jgi:lysophospholipase
LYNQKYSVYIHDHRGQGRSGRLYAADTQRGHVDNFDYYVDDLRTFVQNYVKPSTHAHVFLLAHSMGGGIATRYLEKYGGQFNAVALVTPMHAPLVPAFGLDLSTPLCSASRTSLVSALLPATNFAINQTDWKENAVNDVTNSAERYKIKHNDASKIGGITHGWFREACRAGAEARANAANVTIPTLILQAGRDTAVSNRAQKEFCDRMNEKTKGRCEGYVFPDALHAIFIEEDTIRTPALTKILDFFAAHA